MNFESLKEQLLDRARSIWAQIQESSTYTQLRDRYDELSPNAQKLVLASVAGLVLLFVFSFPLMNIDSSRTHMTEFEDNRELLRELLAVQRELAQTPEIPPAPDPEGLRGRVAGVLQSSNLSPEQIRKNEIIDPKSDPPTTLIPASVRQNAVEIVLLKLNLKQVVDIGHQLQNMANNVFLTSMDMKANSEDNHYYDVIFRLVGFAVDAPAETAPQGNPTAGAKPTPTAKPPSDGGG